MYINKNKNYRQKYLKYKYKYLEYKKILSRRIMNNSENVLSGGTVPCEDTKFNYEIYNLPYPPTKLFVPLKLNYTNFKEIKDVVGMTEKMRAMFDLITEIEKMNELLDLYEKHTCINLTLRDIKAPDIGELYTVFKKEEYPPISEIELEPLNNLNDLKSRIDNLTLNDYDKNRKILWNLQKKFFDEIKQMIHNANPTDFLDCKIEDRIGTTDLSEIIKLRSKYETEIKKACENLHKLYSELRVRDADQTQLRLSANVNDAPHQPITEVFPDTEVLPRSRDLTSGSRLGELDNVPPMPVNYGRYSAYENPY